MTHTYHPYGGVLKTLDYAVHARTLGYRIEVRSPEAYSPTAEIFGIDRIRGLCDDPGVRYGSFGPFVLGPDDLVLFSLPLHYERALSALPERASPERLIHLVQNTRHTNPTWLGGYPLRLLTRPASRIVTSSVIAEEIRPFLDPRALLWVNTIGHDLDRFRHERVGGFSAAPLRVLYTTWKTEIGDGVASYLADDDRFEFRAIRDTVSWSELRDHYRWSDVFLSTPNRQEGTYLPGLEAMAAGSVVITPDVGGNMDYCRPGENCLMVDFGAVHDYGRALLALVDAAPERIASVRIAAYAVTAEFGLDRELAGFAAFLDQLWNRVAVFEDSSDTDVR
ncbi:MAG: glycosyltransferase [Nocardioides sp.]